MTTHIEVKIADSEPNDKPPKPWRRWLVLTVLIIGVAVGANRAYVLLFEQPAVGTVTVGTPEASSNSFDISMTPAVFTGKTISFSYPDGLAKKQPSPLVGPDVEKASFTAKDIVTWNLEIDVTNNGSQPLSGDSGYSFRVQHPDIYQPSTAQVDGQSVPVMTDKSAPGFSKVAFLQHGQYQATVSLIGDDADGSAPLQAAFTMVLSSWHWQ
jgi:hypothetical protein